MSNPNIPTSDWRAQLSARLPYLGHRNWIAVVDSAYPLQTGSGVDMLWTGEDMLPVLEYAFAEIDKAAHVAPTIFVDAELGLLSETDGPGITAYRDQLGALLRGRVTTAPPHEEIIAMIDAAASRFQVLVLKTRFVLPYTSVFFRLECGYWDDAREARLRALADT